MTGRLWVLMLNILILCFSISSPSITFAYSGEADDAEKDGYLPVVVSGILNVREIMYFNGTTAYDYLLMVDEDTEGGTYARYLLESDKRSENDLEDLVAIAGSEVSINGFTSATDRSSRLHASESGSDLGDVEAPLEVSTIEVIDDIEPAYAERSVTQLDFQLKTVGNPLKQITVPARYADIQATPHTRSYYTGQFYEDNRYSLASYWQDASYGNFGIEGKVADWVDLPGSENQYQTFGGRESGLITAADNQIDFDGADNEIQNITPDDVKSQSKRDDIDSIIGVFNGKIGSGDIAGYSYLEPIRLTTGEGSIYAYFIAIADNGYGSPVGVPSNYFVGLAAHEMGHNLGWFHTATQSCTYCDPWSLMSGGIYSEFGPSGPIASHRETEGWIAPKDILYVARDGNEEQVIEFELDMLGKPTGTNYLMAKVALGDGGDYYTVEARRNVVNDHTPSEQTGLVVYHYSPTGHPESLEPRSFETLIDTTGTGDLENADIDVGDSFVDTENKITITNLGDSEDNIKVRVTLAEFQPDNSQELCNGLRATIVGTPGNDVLNGTMDSDVISAMAGDDIIHGMSGDDVICGGHGNDLIEGGDGKDIIFGNFGDDQISGGAGNDVIVGGRGDDDLQGGDGNDVISGWSDNDKLFGGDGDDELYGGDGNDYILGGDGNDKLRGWIGNDVYADKSDFRGT